MTSPRAYFGRASRMATGSLRAGISEVRDPAVPTPERPPVFRAGNPALRLFGDLKLPEAPTAPLTGAVVVVSGICDEDHEKVLVDLGTSLIRSMVRRDNRARTLTLILSRLQSAETYAAVLASLRYINDSPTPTKGIRRATLQVIDPKGRSTDVASVIFGVGEAPSPSAITFVTSDDRVVDGEKTSFNTDGEYTVYWWPHLLANTARRGRASTLAPDPAESGSIFSAGGSRYCIFDWTGAGAASPSARAAAENGAVGASDRTAVPQQARNGTVLRPTFRRRTARTGDASASDAQAALARQLMDQQLSARR